MTTERVLIVLLFAVLIGVIVRNRLSGGGGAGDSAGVPPAIATILERKSVRSFTGEPVSKETVETILRAGMAAPSARNKQPWAFVAVTERATLDALAERLPYAKMLREAPLAIVVLGDLERALDGVERDYWVQDCAAVTENILLAVEALGLGAVWTGVHPVAEREETVREVLGLPATLVPLNVIPIGHPKADTPPKQKFDPARIHWERW